MINDNNKTNGVNNMLTTNGFNKQVTNGMQMIRVFKAGIIEEGHEFNINVDSCKWAIEQAICNRETGVSMSEAVVDYIADIKYRVYFFNGLNKGQTT